MKYEPFLRCINIRTQNDVEYAIISLTDSGADSDHHNELDKMFYISLSSFFRTKQAVQVGAHLIFDLQEISSLHCSESKGNKGACLQVLGEKRDQVVIRGVEFQLIGAIRWKQETPRSEHFVAFCRRSNGEWSRYEVTESPRREFTGCLSP